MLKFFFFFLFMIPLFMNNLRFWLVQNFYFFFFFFFFLFFFYNQFWGGLVKSFGCDLLSWSLVLLSIWICGLMIMSSEKVFKENNFFFLFNLLIFFLFMFLMFSFFCFDLFLFYLFFESSLIPILFLVLGWGYQPERIQAGMYLLFYTLMASFPLLCVIFFIYNNFFSFNMFLIKDFNCLNFLFFFSLIFAFLVKMPMFLVHLWLPKAHVEAPVAGSMILAAILLKLGGYGLLRIFPMIQFSFSDFSILIFSISFIGGFFVSLMCLRQIDMKSLIAYSSVAHMSLVVIGIFTFSNWGFQGSLVLMLAHGLCSSGLFSISNICYERFKSRSLMINKGLMNFMPSLSMWWFLLCIGNMAAPPSLNLLGEISLINSAVSWSFLSMVFISLLSFFSAAYSLFLFSFCQQGKIFSGLFGVSFNYIREFLILFLHVIPLNLLILKVEICFCWV